jgi:hypothetical protein
MKFITLHMIERGTYNEDTQQHDEAHKPCIVNAAFIRCFYPRRDAKPGTRITFGDGGGFAVTEDCAAVAEAVAAGDVARLTH